MWVIEASPGPKVAYQGGWYHFDSGYTTKATKRTIAGLFKDTQENGKSNRKHSISKRR